MLQKESEDDMDFEDAPTLLRTTSKLTPRDIILPEDNLVIHGLDPNHTDQLRDMTATLQSKKSVR